MLSEVDCIGGIVFYFCNQCVETVEQKVWIELVLQGGVTGCVIFFLKFGSFLLQFLCVLNRTVR